MKIILSGLKKMKAAPTPDQVQIAVTSNSLGHLLCEIGEHDAALKVRKTPNMDFFQTRGNQRPSHAFLDADWFF